MIIVLASLALVVFSALSRADQMFCGQYDGTQIGNVKFSTNAWGADGSGGTCIEISNTSSLFTTTWNYSSNPTRVHSYPNIGILDPILPLRLSSLDILDVSLLWSIGAAIASVSPSSSAPAIDVPSLKSLNAISNVAIDMFLEVDQGKAATMTQAQYEVMIWFSTMGGIQPVQDSSISSGGRSCEIAGMKLTLSIARNQANQTVHTWLASSNMTTISRTDFAPLLQYLHTISLLP